MSNITIQPLGAGQEVGRSCILVRIQGKTILFDAGLHMGYQDSRRFPYFNLISPKNPKGPFTDHIDAVVVSHFHLDHCGALAYFTERLGYNGPLIMTYPTKCIVPLLLNDFQRIMTGQNPNDELFFSNKDIERCIQKVTCIGLNNETEVAPGVFLTAFYAGHVLGAAMFLLRVGTKTVLYTGDFNTTPDRHLGAARLPCFLNGLDVLITESTYARMTRDSRRFREQEFLNRVKNAVFRQGKVLIPVFALGRAQELCVLLDSFWQQIGLTGRVPIYLAGGLSAASNHYYKLFSQWTNETMLEGLVDFEKPVHTLSLPSILPFKRSLLEELSDSTAPSMPVVVLATPGMLHTGLSLEIFRKWCSDERNLVVIPGYCSPGTVGNRVLSGEKKITLTKEYPGEIVTLDVKCEVANLSFSAHADTYGILSLIQSASPSNVVLVHGEKSGMIELRSRVARELGVEAHCPPTKSTLVIKPSGTSWFDTKIQAISPPATLASNSSSKVVVRNKICNNLNQNSTILAHIAAHEASLVNETLFSKITSLIRTEQKRIQNYSSTAIINHSTDPSTIHLTNPQKRSLNTNFDMDSDTIHVNKKQKRDISIYSGEETEFENHHPYAQPSVDSDDSPSLTLQSKGSFIIPKYHPLSSARVLDGFLASTTNSLEIQSETGTGSETVGENEELNYPGSLFITAQEGIELIQQYYHTIPFRVISTHHLTISRVFISIIRTTLRWYWSAVKKLSNPQFQHPFSIKLTNQVDSIPIEHPLYNFFRDMDPTTPFDAVGLLFTLSSCIESLYFAKVEYVSKNNKTCMAKIHGTSISYEIQPTSSFSDLEDQSYAFNVKYDHPDSEMVQQIELLFCSLQTRSK